MITNIQSDYLKGRNHLEDVNVHERMILKLKLNCVCVCVCEDLYWIQLVLRYCLMAGFCEHGNDLSLP